MLSGLSCLAAHSWLSYLCCLAHHVSCSSCPVLSDMYCPVSLVLAVLSWPSYPGRHVLAVMSWLSSPGCPVLAVLSWLSCLDRPVLMVLFCQSCPGLPALVPFSCISALTVVHCLNYFGCPVLGYPALAVLFWAT